MMLTTPSRSGAGSAVTCTNRQPAGHAGARPKRSEKSSALPSSSTTSASARRALAPRSHGSLSPRGLSDGSAGTASDRASFWTAAQRRPRAIPGPATITGRLASVSAASAAVTSLARASAGGATATGAGLASGTFASSTSPGRLRCTGPGRPDCASARARATSCPRRAGSSAVHAAFVTGRAAAAWSMS